jgi:cell division protein FtsN
VEYYTTQARRRRSSQPPAWLWFFAGLLVGALAVGLAWMKQEGAPKVAKEQPTETEPAAKTEVKKEEKPTQLKKTEKPKTNFEFYTVLPEMEVVVPEQEIDKPISPATAQPSQKPDTSTSGNSGEPAYLLQMGSFQNYKDADRLKARLGLLGIEADIQSVTIDSKAGKQTTHRVRSGPYSRNQAHDMHEMLKKEKIDSIAILIKK